VPKNKQKSQENEDEQLEELHQIWRWRRKKNSRISCENGIQYEGI
jgi:hypothetical protein